MPEPIPELESSYGSVPPKLTESSPQSRPPAVAPVGLLALTAEQLAVNLAGRPAEHIAAFERFRHYAILHGWDYKRAASVLRQDAGGRAYGKDTLSHAMGGHRDAAVSLAPLVDAIDRFFLNAEGPAPIGGYIETRMCSEIQKYLEWVRREWRIGMIVGANANGKSSAQDHLEKQLPWLKVIRVPEGGARKEIMSEIADKEGIGRNNNLPDMAKAIIDLYAAESTERNRILITWDEFDECLGAGNERNRTRTVQFMRRVYDKGHVAQTCVVDPSGYRKLQTVGPDSPLRKLMSRRLEPLVLPAFYREDLDLFATHHGLEPATGKKIKAVVGGDDYEDDPLRIQDEICGGHKDGLFMWLGILRRAVERAGKLKRDVEWGDVLAAYALHTFMENSATEMAVRTSTGKEAKKK